MGVMHKARFSAFLEEHNQETWNQVLDSLSPSIHPVDRNATHIWFAFWPLELAQALRQPEGLDEMARIMDLEGKWHLEEQIDSSVEFLYGAKHWPAVKKAVREHAKGYDRPEGKVLEQRIRDVARAVGQQEAVDESLLLGITAIAFMILQQVGMESFASVVDKPAAGVLHKLPADEVIKRREKRSRGGLYRFFRGLGGKYRVVWDEKRKDGHFQAVHGQDFAMAAATDRRDFRSMDYRRIDGPIPVECRVASCGYCWVGILHGKDSLTEITDFERERLHYFGYDSTNKADESRPLIRLACQTQCMGDVTLVIPPWNGELKRRHNKSPEALGTA